MCADTAIMFLNLFCFQSKFKIKEFEIFNLCAKFKIFNLCADTATWAWAPRLKKYFSVKYIFSGCVCRYGDLFLGAASENTTEGVCMCVCVCLCVCLAGCLSLSLCVCVCECE